ncbi:hypothetical protein As57867_016290, partial [Aphanomyces stellatus]
MTAAAHHPLVLAAEVDDEQLATTVGERPPEGTAPVPTTPIAATRRHSISAQATQAMQRLNSLTDNIRERLPISYRHRLTALFDFGSWCLVLFLMTLQVVNVFSSTTTTHTTKAIGTSPFTTAVALVPGNNDDPYIDRAMACVLVGRVYKSMTLAQAMQDASVVDHSSITADSYTVMVRPDPQTTLGDTYATFDDTCTAIALSIDGILHACADQGYVPVTDTLKINVGTDATHTTELVDALPILILPYWDNGNIARFGVPGQDGVMCSIKLYNMFVGPGSFYQVAVINRADYDAHTRQWLHEPHGSWQNGWYTFPDGVTR